MAHEVFTLQSSNFFVSINKAAASANAYRSAIVYNLPVRVAKDLMGHSLDVHVKHYGSFIDAPTGSTAVLYLASEPFKPLLFSHGEQIFPCEQNCEQKWADMGLPR